METLAPVDLDLAAMRRVVDQEGGCIVWGGAVQLSPADDVMIRISRALDLDAEGPLVASVLSKKIAAGASHLVLDVPVGTTAKIRSEAAAESLSASLLHVAGTFGLQARVLLTDGSQPVGRGIGPALEARDVVSVLKGQESAPQDLATRAVTLAGALLELAGTVARAAHLRPVLGPGDGRAQAIDNRRLALAAKLAGAPDAKAAGVDLHVRLGDAVEAGAPLFTLHTETPGELDYAIDYVASEPDIISLTAP